MKVFAKITAAIAQSAVVVVLSSSAAHSDDRPAPEHVAYMLEKYGFGRLTTTGVEYPKAELTITSPTADVPTECARFVGARQGALSNGRPLMVVVTDISAQCDVTVWMAWGSEPDRAIDIGDPWQKASNGIYKRNGRNMPVGKLLTGKVSDGKLKLEPTRKTTATFVIRDEQLNVRWGSTTAELAPFDLRAVRFVVPVAPAGA